MSNGNDKGIKVNGNKLPSTFFGDSCVYAASNEPRHAHSFEPRVATTDPFALPPKPKLSAEPEAQDSRTFVCAHCHRSLSREEHYIFSVVRRQYPKLFPAPLHLEHTGLFSNVQLLVLGGKSLEDARRLDRMAYHQQLLSDPVVKRDAPSDLDPVFG